MHRIWISRQSSIPIREQLSAQLLFGIVSRRFSPSARLPSVRDLARRLKVHPNTVSAAYQDLAARGWVKRRTGSGVFVCDMHSDKGEGVDTFVQAWIDEGLGRGFSFEALSTAFEKARVEFAAPREPRKLLVVHPDRNLARILAAEIQEAVGCAVPCAGVEDAPRVPDFETFLLLTTTSGAGAVSQISPEGHQLIPLKSIEEVLAGLGRPESPVLIGIVSRSQTILNWASMLLPALGLDGSDLIQRNPEQPNWRHGLAACGLIASDVLAARELPKNVHPIVLRLVSEPFLQEARELVTAEKV
ncbi:MAG TPA: GntR family transcriptional regulator [Bryobacteraceae bacterium]|nr:GntR family transcriptional regulator [Bryobacteraceae bacterium]